MMSSSAHYPFSRLYIQQNRGYQLAYHEMNQQMLSQREPVIPMNGPPPSPEHANFMGNCLTDDLTEEEVEQARKERELEEQNETVIDITKDVDEDEPVSPSTLAAEHASMRGHSLNPYTFREAAHCLKINQCVSFGAVKVAPGPSFGVTMQANTITPRRPPTPSMPTDWELAGQPEQQQNTTTSVVDQPNSIVAMCLDAEMEKPLGESLPFQLAQNGLSSHLITHSDNSIYFPGFAPSEYLISPNVDLFQPLSSPSPKETSMEKPVMATPVTPTATTPVAIPMPVPVATAVVYPFVTSPRSPVAIAASTVGPQSPLATSSPFAASSPLATFSPLATSSPFAASSPLAALSPTCQLAVKPKASKKASPKKKGSRTSRASRTSRTSRTTKKAVKKPKKTSKRKSPSSRLDRAVPRRAPKRMARARMPETLEDMFADFEVEAPAAVVAAATVPPEEPTRARRSQKRTRKQRDDDDESEKSGLSCHQCKSLRELVFLTFCIPNKKTKTNNSSSSSSSVRNCRKKFCDKCLLKFYGEEPGSNSADVNPDPWSCPACRDLCSCAACRRKYPPEKAAMMRARNKNGKRRKVKRQCSEERAEFDDELDSDCPTSDSDDIPPPPRACGEIALAIPVDSMPCGGKIDRVVVVGAGRQDTHPSRPHHGQSSSSLRHIAADIVTYRQAPPIPERQVTFGEPLFDPPRNNNPRGRQSTSQNISSVNRVSASSPSANQMTDIPPPPPPMQPTGIPLDITVPPTSIGDGNVPSFWQTGPPTIGSDPEGFISPSSSYRVECDTFFDQMLFDGGDRNEDEEVDPHFDAFQFLV